MIDAKALWPPPWCMCEVRPPMGKPVEKCATCGALRVKPVIIPETIPSRGRDGNEAKR